MLRIEQEKTEGNQLFTIGMCYTMARKMTRQMGENDANI